MFPELAELMPQFLTDEEEIQRQRNRLAKAEEERLTKTQKDAMSISKKILSRLWHFDPKDSPRKR